MPVERRHILIPEFTNKFLPPTPLDTLATLPKVNKLRLHIILTPSYIGCFG